MTSTYLDAASAVPPHPVVRQALEAASHEGWMDPGRLYTGARRAHQLLDAARETVADVVGARPAEVSFTANGTQAVHAAILGALDAGRRRGRVFVHSAVEHSAVLRAARWHSGRGGESVPVPVGRNARVDVAALADAAGREGVGLVAVQSANHEVGTTQPLAEVVEACGEVPLFVDAAQSLGRERLPEGWSLLAGSARKWGGPAGVGVLVVREGTRWRSPWPDDPGESGAPGSHNLPAIVAAAAALRAAAADMDAEDARLRGLTARLRTELARIPYVDVVGDPKLRLPHIVTFSNPFEDGEPLLHALNEKGFAVSAGSACTASTLRPSHVLEAMGVLSYGNIRVSLHRDTTADDVDRFLAVVPRVLARLRSEAGVEL